ncbi:MAG: response regulator transcription factor [Candidatus Acidiferrales bacterium]
MIRILIADDHHMVRLAVSQLVEEADENWKVCCEVGDGNAAVEKSAELKPDLAMLDFAMPDLDGITAGQQIRALSPDTSVLVYTFMVTPQLQAFVKSAGLQGVVPKADTGALIAEIRRVLSAARTAKSSRTEPIPQSGAAN